MVKDEQGNEIVETVSPEAAESMPLEELRQRLRAEASRAEEGTLTPNVSGEEQEAAENESDADSETQQDEADQSTQESEDQESTDSQEQQNAGTQRQKPQTIEEAIRVADSLRGNLNQLSQERKQMQAQLKELQDAAARQQQQGEEARLRAQHQQVEQYIANLPDERQQATARQHYQNQLQQAALNDYYRNLQSQQQEIHNAQLTTAKGQATGWLGEVLDFAAEQRGLAKNATELSEVRDFLKSDQVQNAINAATTPEALAVVMATVGEVVDWRVLQAAATRSKAKEVRRTTTKPVVRDVPGTSQASEVTEAERIQSMSSEDFLAFRKGLRRKAEANA